MPSRYGIGQEITKRALKQGVALRRYENTVAREVGAHLAGTRRALVDILTSRDPTAVTRGWTTTRVNALYREAGELLTEEYSALGAMVRQRLVGVGSAVGENTVATLRLLALQVESRKSFVGPTRAYLHSLVTTDPVQGNPLSVWWQTQRRATQVAFRREVTVGLSRGEGIGDLVTRIRGERVGDGRYVGGIMNTTSRNAEAIARTAVNQIANRAAIDTYKAAGSRFTERFEFLATLDDRTTEECAAFDGTVWSYEDTGAPIPPLHVNCRSTIIPVVNYEELGLEPPNEERTTYAEWFAEQDTATQDDILGPGRADLVRAGSVTFRDLVAKDGSRIPLADLTLDEE